MLKIKKNYTRKQKAGLTVYVVDDNVERAIKKMRRIMKQSGVMEAYHDHRYYIKPSVVKAKKRSTNKFKAKIWQQKQDARFTEN